jgi:soluble lytic murein transglycosylase-like protein
MPGIEAIISAVIWVESRGVPTATHGCYRGLMQVCTRWAHCTPDELYNPEINRREGERLLRYWYRQGGNDWGKALAAYNCGWNGLKGKCGTAYANRVLRLARSL